MKLKHNIMKIKTIADIHNLIDLIYLSLIKLIQYKILKLVSLNTNILIMNNFHILLIISFFFNLKKYFLFLFIIEIIKYFYLLFINYKFPLIYLKRIYILINLTHIFKQQKYEIFSNILNRKKVNFSIEDIYFIINNKNKLEDEEYKYSLFISYLLTLIYCLNEKTEVIIFFYIFFFNYSLIKKLRRFNSFIKIIK